MPIRPFRWLGRPVAKMLNGEGRFKPHYLPITTMNMKNNRSKPKRIGTKCSKLSNRIDNESVQTDPTHCMLQFVVEAEIFPPYLFFSWNHALGRTKKFLHRQMCIFFLLKNPLVPFVHLLKNFPPLGRTIEGKIDARGTNFMASESCSNGQNNFPRLLSLSALKSRSN